MSAPEAPEATPDKAADPTVIDDPAMVGALKLTEIAAEKVKAVHAAENIESHFGLRIKVVGGGCSGFQYDLYFDEPGEGDYVLDSNDVKLLCDQMSFMYLMGTTIDYVETLHGAGFKFDNPNTTGSCGCGSSDTA
jgi:iron-sulfur cluster insertion protein